TPSVVEYSTAFLRGMCLSLPFICMDFMAVGIFQSCGMGKKSLIFAILRKIVLEIPAIYILNHFFPLYGLAYAQTTAEIILSIIAVIVLINLFRKLKAEQLNSEV
ncbi:MAG: MATE family efflux transporter, partial [Clostridia bacterium]|nr:MATE family efflux transporter [Clostridia bacterium]